MKVRFKISIIIFCFILSNISCSEDLLELNENPNVSTGNVDPKQLFGSVLFGYLEQIDGSKSRFNAGFGVCGQWAQQFAIKNDVFGYYATDNGLFNRVWEEFYNISGSLRNANALIELSEEQDFRAYEACTRILKVYMFSVITDLWGDVPYFDAGKANLEGSQFQLPVFDMQENIYDDMISQLEIANNLLSRLRANERVENDLLYSGNMLKWRKFSNSLKLRLLVRISNKKDTWPKVTEIFNNPSTFPIFESIDDQANIRYNIDGAVYPPHWLTEAELTREQVDRTSETMVKILTKTSTVDPRLFVFCEPTQESVFSGGPLEYVGQPVGLINDTAPQSQRSTLGLGIRNLEIYWLQSYAEVELIRTEAQFLGHVGGNASDSYNKGIQASFDSFVTQNQLELDYFNNPENHFSDTNALEQIITQRWIDNFLNGYEGLSVWRRTGFPDLVAVSGQSTIPRRFIYPDKSLDTNPLNAQNAIDRNPLNGNNTIFASVWWDDR
ncbi:MAG: SusD/RagB family nutrient-binding outer membrane lipoprotein [Flavobacteriaceae bacterium]